MHAVGLFHRPFVGWGFFAVCCFWVRGSYLPDLTMTNDTLMVLIPASTMSMVFFTLSITGWYTTKDLKSHMEVSHTKKFICPVAKSRLTSTTTCLHPHIFGCLFPYRKELAGLRQRSFALEAVGMPAQVSKFGENKPFTNRNVCFGSRNKLLAAHETFVSRFKTHLFRGQKAHIGVSRSKSQFDKMLTGCHSM